MNYTDIAVINHCCLDLHLSVENRIMRPWLSVLVNNETKQMLAFHLEYEAPTSKSYKILLEKYLAHNGQLPKIIIITDGDKQFRNEHFISFINKHGITLEFHKNKPPIPERFFHATTKQFISSLKGDNKKSSRP